MRKIMDGGRGMNITIFIVIAIVGIIVLFVLKGMNTNRSSIKLKIKKKNERNFKTFRVIESKGRYIWYEENKLNVI